MPHDNNRAVFYELKGKSLSSALDLRAKIHQELLPALSALQKSSKDNLPSMIHATMLATPILLGQNVVSYAQAAKSFSERDFLPLVEAFKEKYKDLYDLTGQNSRSVKISHVENAYPRAYAYTPEVYFHPGSNGDRVVLMAPVDYKKRNFQPEDAVLLNEEEAHHVANGLWLHGHSDPIPVIHRQTPYGVQTPPDFDLATSTYTKHAAPYDHNKIDILKKAFLFEKIYLVESGAIPGVSNPEDVDFFVHIQPHPETNRPEILVRAFTRADNISLTIRENAYFRPEPAGTHLYKVIPQANKPDPKTNTAGGMALQSALDAVPNLPAEEVWKTCDAADKSVFIKSPPPPKELLHLYPKASWPFPKSTPSP